MDIIVKKTELETELAELENSLAKIKEDMIILQNNKNEIWNKIERLRITISFLDKEIQAGERKE